MEHITMSKKEREQLVVFQKIKNKEITQAEASLQLEVTERWVRKKFKRYLELGDIGLVHKSRNRKSNRRWAEDEKKLTIDLLKSEWHGFGPTFTAEKLLEQKNIKVSKETVRKAMIQAGLWDAKKKKIKHRKYRERRSVIGLLVQLDGSPHDWFEGRGPRCTLLVFIDDATSKILWLEFAESESIKGVMQATKNYISRFGRPHEFYVDFGSVFSVNLNNPERDKKTQWERAMKELFIKVGHAHSPQAKGRVERANGTLQDRLVKEMRLAGISSIETANKFLCESDFISNHNKRFAIVPAKKGNAHRPINTFNLDDIFCIKEERILGNDYTISYKKCLLQLSSEQPAIIRPKNSITVKTYLDGSVKLSIRNINLEFKEINKYGQRQIERTKIVKECIYRKPSKNSYRWASGLVPLPNNNHSMESR
jgi:hypothetical protein